jgi:hypothetical protein
VNTSALWLPVTDPSQAGSRAAPARTLRGTAWRMSASKRVNSASSVRQRCASDDNRVSPSVSADVAR